MKLHVLMSTYNGGTYLREQLDSICDQTLFQKPGWEVRVVVRDDGSTDETCGILEEYAHRFSQITYDICENIGVVDSFFELLLNTPQDVDFVALSDQDDVWCEDKLESAVRALKEKPADKPLLYCGMVQLADEQLQPAEGVFFPEGVRPSFGNALIENICTGCTAVINQTMLRLVQRRKPEFTAMHDWWLYLLASCLGEVVYDPTPHMYYRQHMGNVVGVKRNYFAEFWGRVKRYRKNRYQISRQVMSLRNLLDQGRLDPGPEKQEMMEQILCGGESVRSRMETIRNRDIYRQRKVDNMIFKVIFLTGKV